MEKEKLTKEELYLKKLGERGLLRTLKYVAKSAMTKEFDYLMFGKRDNRQFMAYEN